MAYLSIKLDGLEELVRALNSLPAEVEAEVQKGIEMAANRVLNKARSKVPVKSGELRDSLKLGKLKKGNFYIATSVTFTNPKGVPVELGHRIVSHGKVVGSVKERPFLRPAFDEEVKNAEGDLTNAFNNAMDKMGGIK